MVGKPKFVYNDPVSYELNGSTVFGRVFVIDAFGTFANPSDVSYDVLTDYGGTPVFVKHIREDCVNKAEEKDVERLDQLYKEAQQKQQKDRETD